MTVYQAKRLGITNFSLLVSHVLVPPAIAAIMESPTCRVQAFLAAGHVCSVMGTSRVPTPRREVRRPDRRHRLRAARHPRGHPAHRHPARGGPARARERLPARGPPTRATSRRMEMLRDVFEVTDRTWRGIGMIPQSGWRLSERYAELRRRAAVLGQRHPHRRVAAVPLRRGAAGPDQAARVRGLRQGVHAAQPARRDDGVLGGRLRGVLHLPPARASAARRAGGEPMSTTWTSRAGSARCRCGTPRRS